MGWLSSLQSIIAAGAIACAQVAAGAAAEKAPDTSSTPKPATLTPTTPPSRTAARSSLSQITLINELVRKGWTDHGVKPSQAATDGEWCRRVYLDVLGRVPSVAELDRFVADKSSQKRAALVDRLLSNEYVEEYARNWTSIWTNLLIGRTGGTDRNTMTNRDGMMQYVRRSFQKNKRYDTFVYELVSASGNNAAGENGAVNFLTGKMGENGVQATAKTAQIFLGLQVQCTQCHNHPFNDWKQNQFWELNAFFRQTKANSPRDPKERMIKGVELKDQDFVGETRDPQQADLFFEMRNGVMKVAYPVFVDGTEVNKSGRVKDIQRRTELAKLIRSSPYMSQAIVNRTWAHFLGYGFTKPVDDMGPHNPPSHPELLEGLAAEFVSSNYNLKELIRWIVLSEPYSLSSRFGPRNLQDDPTLGEKPMFSHFYLRQMRLEELYESLLVATEADKIQANEAQQEEAKRVWLRQFTIAFGTDDNEETTTFNGTIPQALMMFNGEMIRRATSLEEGSFLHRIATDEKIDSRQKIHRLYLAALARRPGSEEITDANFILDARRGDVASALADVWWAVLNSNEFILNH